MALSGCFGFPNIGSSLDISHKIQGFLNNDVLQETLEISTKKIRLQKWITQKKAGIDWIASNDFSYFDFVLDTSFLFGVIPKRFGWNPKEPANFDTYFKMVGYQIEQNVDSLETIAPLKAKTFFDTKYHYVVPEFTKGQSFSLTTQKPVLEYLESKSYGIETIPSLLGPFSFLLLGSGDFDRLSLIYRLMECYESLLKKLKARGADWIYMHEPCLTLQLTHAQQKIFYQVYKHLLSQGNMHMVLLSYFGSIIQNWQALDKLPFSAIHLDLVAEPKQLDFVLSKNLESYSYLSLGVVDAKNIWKNDLAYSMHYLEKASQKIGVDKIIVAPTSSLLFVPYDKDLEDFLSPAMKKIQHKLAFAKQKAEEVVLLTKGLNKGTKAIQAKIDASLSFKPVTNTVAKNSIFKESFFQKIANGRLKIRKNNTQTRAKKQILDSLSHNLLTTSAPLSLVTETNQETKETHSLQSQLGLDLIALGEVDFYDRLESFCSFLSGFAITKNAWVQSFGLQCYKPLILYDDVKAPDSHFLNTFIDKNIQHSKNLKALLMTPSVILTQSFLRNDKTVTALLEEISQAVHKTLLNLEKANISFIQWENPPLKTLSWDNLHMKQLADENLNGENSQQKNKDQWQDEFLEQTVRSLAFCCRNIKDKTQIHIYSNSPFFLLQLDSLEMIDVCFLKISKDTTFSEIVKEIQYLKKRNIKAKIALEINNTALKNREFEETTFLKILKSMNNSLNPQNIWVSVKASTGQKWLERDVKEFMRELKSYLDLKSLN